MKDIACQPCVIGKSIAQGERERKHPLPDGNFRQYAIHKMRGRIGHPAPPARRAEAPPFAGKRHDTVVSTGIAMDAQEATRQDPAVQKRAQLAFDEPGHRAFAAALSCQEGL